MFCNLWKPVTSALKITASSRPRHSIVKVDEDDNFQEQRRKECFITNTKNILHKNVLFNDKSTYEDIERVRAFHSRTSSFLTLCKERKKVKSV